MPPVTLPGSFTPSALISVSSTTLGQLPMMRPPLDVIAQDHGGKTAPVIGAERAVLIDAPAELGHDQHRHVLRDAP